MDLHMEDNEPVTTELASKHPYDAAKLDVQTIWLPDHVRSIQYMSYLMWVAGEVDGGGV